MKKNKRKNKKVMIISGYCLFLSLCVFSIASAENYIGIILDGYQKDCLVQSSSGEYYDCNESRQLYVGDKIIKKDNIRSLKIKWAPYARAKESDKSSMTVIFEPPKDKKSIMRGIKEYLGLVKTGHSVSIGATRGVSGEVVQPSNNATLISEQKTTYVWESGGGEYIIFKDSNGSEIFRKDIKGELFLKISPEEIGMKPGEVYLWNVSGIRNNRQFKIRFLSQDLSNLVKEDIRSIEKENTGAVDKMIQKAGYLQFISDSYPLDIDLYWLSYLILMENKDERVLKDDDKILIRELKNNYLNHVREGI